jgi:hypothetical protein
MYGRTRKIPSKAEEFLIKRTNPPRAPYITISDDRNVYEQD